MSESKRSMVSLGVFLIILVVSILLYATGILVDYLLLIPLVLVLFGCWLMVSAYLVGSSPQKYGPSAFSTLGLGLFLASLGVAWYLFTINMALYGVALVILVLAALTVVGALRAK